MWLEKARPHGYCNQACDVIHFCLESFTYLWNPRSAAQPSGTGGIGGSSVMYRAVTRNIEVVVTPRFVADRSSQDNNYFFWAYTISITNNGAETVQLKTRHWRITDAHGRRQEVRGAGVVGEEPVLKAGEAFEYTSGVPLQTPSGFMVGTYGMVSAAGEHFDIEVPAFSLDSVESKRTIN
jgi:ApaG protein